MFRPMALALGASVVLGTLAWGQGPRGQGRPPAKPPGSKEPDRQQRADGKEPHRHHAHHHHFRPVRVVGWPYWFGYPAVYSDPFGFPVGPGIPVYHYDFSFHNPLLDVPPPTLPPVEPPAPRNDPPPEPKLVVKRKEEPRQKDELERRADAQKLVRQGGEAFAQGDYAKAGRLYQQAADAAPLEPTGFFHLAQAQLAQNKLAEAGVSIQRGLMLRPDWPNAPFDPRALYGEMAGHYDQHLAKLADLVARHKNDDGLLFLLGYQLWFDGKRDEARVLFERASALTLNAMHVERFLRAKAKPA